MQQLGRGVGRLEIVAFLISWWSAKSAKAASTESSG